MAKKIARATGKGKQPRTSQEIRDYANELLIFHDRLKRVADAMDDIGQDTLFPTVAGFEKILREQLPLNISRQFEDRLRDARVSYGKRRGGDVAKTDAKSRKK